MEIEKGNLCEVGEQAVGVELHDVVVVTVPAVMVSVVKTETDEEMVKGVDTWTQVVMLVEVDSGALIIFVLWVRREVGECGDGEEEEEEDEVDVGEVGEEEEGGGNDSNVVEKVFMVSLKMVLGLDESRVVGGDPAAAMMADRRMRVSTALTF